MRWRTAAAYGEPGEECDYGLIPPARYAARYRMAAVARKVIGGPLAPLRLVVIDRATGASLTFVPGEWVTARIPQWFPPDDVPRLWRDALYLAGLVDRNLAGPPAGTGLDVADVRRAGEELRDPVTGRGPTQEAVAERLGTTARWVSTLCRDHGGYKAVVPLERE